MVWLVAYIVAFLFLSGLMAAVDAAILSVTRPEVDAMAHEGCWGAHRLQHVKRHLTRAVVVIVIATNTINVLGPIIVSRKAFELHGPGALATITIVLTLGTILFSEIIPKAIGAHYAPLVGRLAAPLIQLAAFLLFPLVVTLDRLSKLFMTGSRPIGTEEQVRALVTIGRRAGHIESDEGRMIHRAFVLNDRTARDIMTPLDDTVSLCETDTIGHAVDVVRRNEFSRYPIFGDSPDKVVGIAIGRDILVASLEGRDDDPVATIARPPLVVGGARRSDQLLAIFRDRHMHLAVVRERTSTLGVVTLEDVLEELVGEIEDEKDFEGDRSDVM